MTRYAINAARNSSSRCVPAQPTHQSCCGKAWCRCVQRNGAEADEGERPDAFGQPRRQVPICPNKPWRFRTNRPSRALRGTPGASVGEFRGCCSAPRSPQPPSVRVCIGSKPSQGNLPRPWLSTL